MAKRDNSDWMGRLCDKSGKEHPLTELRLPGSHNSCTSSLDANLPVGPDEPPLTRWLGNRCGCLTKPVFSRWSRCQDLDVSKQLRLGVRYFDFRVCKYKSDHSLRVIHALYGDHVEPIVESVGAFLELHDKEVVILDFQHVYNFKPSDHLMLVDILLSTFSQKLCPIQEDVSELTLEAMVRSKRRVIVVYPAMAKVMPVLWPRYLCPNPWPNTASISRLIPFLRRGLVERNRRRLFVSQGILTPTRWTVVLHVFSSLRKTLSKRCNQSVCSWLSDRPQGLDGLNIVIVDFVENCDALNLIISLND